VPARAARDGHAIDFITDMTAAAPGEITLVATGPLTNIALALRREPRLTAWVRDFVIMGGSAGRGNVTPAAEFNIWADPEAAAMVFAAGFEKLTLVPLDATHRALITQAQCEELEALGTPAGQAAAAAPGEITLVATGPLTNIGLALRREPRLASWVRDFVIMGGSASRGNVTPAAEFNIWADPEAAAIGFGAQWPSGVRMIGLDVTLLARATAAVQDQMRTLGELGSRLLLPALAQYFDSADDSAEPGGEPPVHDVCAIVSIADPSVFDYTPALVQVETHGALTGGMTVADFSKSIIPNARVATAIAADRFWDVTLDAYRSVTARLG
jgi:inosine-uridine nucleoside N-ribohydrolase